MIFTSEKNAYLDKSSIRGAQYEHEIKFLKNDPASTSHVSIKIHEWTHKNILSINIMIEYDCSLLRVYTIKVLLYKRYKTLTNIDMYTRL